MKAVGIRNKLSNQVGDLRVGAAGHKRVGQIEPCCDCLCAHGLAGTSLAPEQEVTHWLAGCRSDFGVLTDTDDLFGDDVPVGQRGHHCQLSCRKSTVGERVLGYKILLLEGRRFRRRCPGHLHDGELPIRGAGGSVVAAVHGHLGNDGDIASRRDGDLDAIRTQLLTVLNATVDIITESQCAFECRIHICPATLKEGDKLLELLPELVILVEDGHEAEQEARTGAVAGTNRIGLQGLCAVLHLCGIEFAGDGVEDHTVRLVGGSILTDAVSSALMPDGAEAIDTLPILRCAHQLGVCEQGPHRRRMERGLLSCTGCVVLGKAHRLGSGIFRVVKGRRLLETEAPSFKQFGLSHNHTSLKNKLGPGHGEFLVTHFSGNVIFACQNTQILPRRTGRKVGDGIHRLLLTTGCDEDISVLLDGQALVALHIQLVNQSAEQCDAFLRVPLLHIAAIQDVLLFQVLIVVRLQFSLRKRNHLDQGDLQLSSGAQRHLTEVEWITVIELDAFGATLADLLGARTSLPEPCDRGIALLQLLHDSIIDLSEQAQSGIIICFLRSLRKRFGLLLRRKGLLLCGHLFAVFSVRAK